MRRVPSSAHEATARVRHTSVATQRPESPATDVRPQMATVHNTATGSAGMIPSA